MKDVKPLSWREGVWSATRCVQRTCCARVPDADAAVLFSCVGLACFCLLGGSLLSSAVNVTRKGEFGRLKRSGAVAWSKRCDQTTRPAASFACSAQRVTRSDQWGVGTECRLQRRELDCV
jgi:hypothetical protein